MMEQFQIMQAKYILGRIDLGRIVSSHVAEVGLYGGCELRSEISLHTMSIIKIGGV